MLCRGLRQRTEVRIESPTRPHRSNFLIFLVIILLLLLFIYSRGLFYSFFYILKVLLSLLKVRKTKHSLPQIKNFQNLFGFDKKLFIFETHWLSFLTSIKRQIFLQISQNVSQVLILCCQNFDFVFRDISRNSRKFSRNTKAKFLGNYENKNFRSHPTLLPPQRDNLTRKCINWSWEENQ